MQRKLGAVSSQRALDLGIAKILSHRVNARPNLQACNGRTSSSEILVRNTAHIPSLVPLSISRVQDDGAVGVVRDQEDSAMVQGRKNRSIKALTNWGFPRAQRNLGRLSLLVALVELVQLAVDVIRNNQRVPN